MASAAALSLRYAAVMVILSSLDRASVHNELRFRVLCTRQIDRGWNFAGAHSCEFPDMTACRFVVNRATVQVFMYSV